MRAWTPASTSLHSLQLLHCSHNKQTTAANSVQWTLQLLVSAARTECVGSLLRARLARAGYRFACFLDAQGTPSLRIRVGQRGQGTRTSAARRGSVVAPASIPQKHPRLVARGRIGSRWLTPVVIDRIRRGTHDRADANGPCRGCATAVSCRAASRTSRRACPLPSPAAHTAHRWRKLEEPRYG